MTRHQPATTDQPDPPRCRICNNPHKLYNDGMCWGCEAAQKLHQRNREKRNQQCPKQ